jgi:hypothetical protein
MHIRRPYQRRVKRRRSRPRLPHAFGGDDDEREAEIGCGNDNDKPDVSSNTWPGGTT